MFCEFTALALTPIFYVSDVPKDCHVSRYEYSDFRNSTSFDMTKSNPKVR
jgi:hypothetical protein